MLETVTIQLVIKIHLKRILASLLVLSCFSVTTVYATITQEDIDDAKQQVDNLQQQVDDVEKELGIYG